MKKVIGNEKVDIGKFRAMSDFRVVALLLYFDVECKFVLTPKENRRKKLFLFDLDKETQNKIDDVLNKYMNGKLEIEPRKFFGLLDRIKDIINSF